MIPVKVLAGVLILTTLCTSIVCKPIELADNHYEQMVCSYAMTNFTWNFLNIIVKFKLFFSLSLKTSPKNNKTSVSNRHFAVFQVEVFTTTEQTTRIVFEIKLC
jgi:hypothetical protein